MRIFWKTHDQHPALSLGQHVLRFSVNGSFVDPAL
jgi:hypothetical protein